MKIKNLLIIGGIILLILIGIIVFNTITGNVVKEDRPKIGGLFGLTGFASFAGESSRDGFLMAIEDYGKPVDYKIEDYKSDMGSTLSAANKLVEVDDFNVIIGPEWEFGAVVSPIAEKKQALFISPWLTIDPEWTKPEFFMSAMSREQSYTDMFSSYMSKKGIKSIVIIRTQDDFALTVERTFKKALRENNISLIEVIPVSVNANDYRTDILRLKELNPDAVYTAMQSDDSQALLNKQLKEMNVNIQTYINSARGDSDLYLNAAGSSAEGVVYISPRETEKLKEFNTKFKKRYGRDPAISAATAYDITTLVLKAYDNGAKTPQEVHDYLNNLEGYQGYSGNFKYSEGFLSGGEGVIKKISGGKRIIIDD